jgi:4a-hydroxytetrahydrobiopterin dehydratase
MGERAGADAGSDWRADAAGLHAWFRTGSLLAAGQFVQAVLALADDLGAEPRLDVSADAVGVRLPGREAELARQISALARELDLPADPSAPPDGA